jgi:signal peptidase
MRRVVRRIVLFIVWVVIGTLGGLVLATGLPNAFHAKSLTVMSGSMEPAIGVGDVVVARETSPMDVRSGDIVTFRDPTDHARLITHRVRGIHVRGREVLFVTRGDANTGEEHWAVPQDGVIGRVVYHIPLMGYFMVWFHSRYGILLLIVLPTLLLGASELWRLWRPRGAHEPGAGRATRELEVPHHGRKVRDEVVV